MSEPGSAPEPPVTGLAEIDEAMTQLADLDQVPLTEHRERLDRAQAVLQQALDGDFSSADHPDHELPGAPDQPPRP